MNPVLDYIADIAAELSQLALKDEHNFLGYLLALAAREAREEKSALSFRLLLTDASNRIEPQAS